MYTHNRKVDDETRATRRQISDYMVNLAEKIDSISIRRAACECGIEHLKTADCLAILQSFQNRCPEWTGYRTYSGNYYTSIFVSKNNQLPDLDCDKDYVVYERRYGNDKAYYFDRPSRVAIEETLRKQREHYGEQQ